MDATKIKEHLDFLKSQGFDVVMTTYYTPESVLYNPEELYNLYYGGHQKIEISNTYYVVNWSRFDMPTAEDFEKGIEKIVDYTKDNIAPYIMQALDNIGEEPEYLKYFDRPEEQPIYDTFKTEVLRLRDEARK